MSIRRACGVITNITTLAAEDTSIKDDSKSFPVEEDDYFLTLCRSRGQRVACGHGRPREDWQDGALWRRIHGEGQRGLAAPQPLACGLPEELDGGG